MAPTLGLIAVGGPGRRLRQSGHQKCLHRLDGRPIFEYLADSFAACGIEHIVFLTGHFHDQVEDYFRDRPAHSARYSSKVVYGGLQGEGHAVCAAKDYLASDFVYADGNIVVLPEMIHDLIRQAEENPSAIAVSTVSPDKQIAPEHPTVLIREETTVIDSVHVFQDGIPEHSRSNVIVGLHYLRPVCLPFIEALPPQRPLVEFITCAAATGNQVQASITKSPWFALHTEHDLLAWETSPLRPHWQQGRLA